MRRSCPEASHYSIQQLGWLENYREDDYSFDATEIEEAWNEEEEYYEEAETVADSYPKNY